MSTVRTEHFPETSAGVTHSYGYDLAGNRLMAQYGGSVTRVAFSAGSSVQEYAGGTGAGATAPTVEFIRGSDWGGGVGGILYSLRGTTGPAYTHYDGRGDVVAKSDAAATVTYQVPRSEWWSGPGVGRRRVTACWKARATTEAGIDPASAQPTIRREQASMTPAKYAHPCRVAT